MLGITYSASSLSVLNTNSVFQPANVFNDEDVNRFHSLSSPADQWWQVSFSKPVAIKSYIIRTKSSWDARPKSWVVNASFDNKTWKQVDEVSLTGDVGGNKTPFLLKKTINCKHFRIILKRNIWDNGSSDNLFVFSFFDCFGTLGKYQRKTIKGYWKYKIFYKVLLSALLNTIT